MIDRCVIGIDPDMSGGVACIARTDHCVAMLNRMPVTVPKPPLNLPAVFDAPALHSILTEMQGFGAVLVVFELPGFMPGKQQGLIKQHQNVGRALGICELVFGRERVQTVSPTEWKKPMGLGSDKALSREKAATMFPSHEAMLTKVKNTGLAEALLLAAWGCEQIA